jgi:hypothetical protein
MEKKIDMDEKDLEVRSMLRGIGSRPVPDGFTDNVLERVRSRSGKTFPLYLRIAVPSLAAAVLVIGFVVLPLFHEERGDKAVSGRIEPAASNATSDSNAETARVPLDPSKTNRLGGFGNATSENPIPTDDEAEIRVDAVKPAPQVKLGPGGRTPSSNPTMGAGTVRPETILSILGVDSEFEDNGWRVNSVVPASVAAKVGIKSGDVIEAVNEVALTKDGVFLKSLSVDRVIVRRAGQRMTLRLSGN